MHKTLRDSSLRLPGIGDGSTTPLWTSGKNAKTTTFTANEKFKELQVRAVEVPQSDK